MKNVTPLMMKLTMSVPLMELLVEQLAIPLSHQSTVAKRLVIATRLSPVKTLGKYTRKGYAVVVRGQGPNNTRRLVIATRVSRYYE